MKQVKYKESDGYETVSCCAFCERSAPLRTDDSVLCSRRGIVSAQYVCRKFSYDPLKRRPRRMPHMPIPSADELKL